MLDYCAAIRESEALRNPRQHRSDISERQPAKSEHAMEKDAPILLYVTMPSPESASKLGRSVVEAGLCACVNILPNMQSIYRWQGEIETAQELVLIAKTTYACANAACEHLVQHHPYDTPCVISLPIIKDGSHFPYLDWIKNEVKDTSFTNDKSD